MSSMFHPALRSRPVSTDVPAQRLENGGQHSAVNAIHALFARLDPNRVHGGSRHQVTLLLV